MSKRFRIKLLTQRHFSAEFDAFFLRSFMAVAWEKVYYTNANTSMQMASHVLCNPTTLSLMYTPTKSAFHEQHT